MPRRYLSHSSWSRFRRPARRFLRSRYKGAYKRRSFRRRRVYRRRRYFGRRHRRFLRKSRHHRKNKGRVTERAVINALQPWQTFTAEYGQFFQVPGVVVGSSRKPSLYQTVELYNSGNTYTQDNITTIELYDYRHLASMFNQVWKNTLTRSFDVAASASTQYDTSARAKLLIKGYQMSQIRNQTVEPALIRAYVLKPRHHIPPLSSGQGTTQNIYAYLAAGFANNGLDSGNYLPSTNSAMITANFTPFMSYDVCKHFIIKPLKPRRLEGGAMTTYKIKGKRMLVAPMDIWYTSGTQTATLWDALNTRIYSFIKGSRILLLKIEGNPAGIGGHQANYSKVIQETQPTFAMDTIFRYEAKFVHKPRTPDGIIENAGITDATTVAHAPTIILPLGNVPGNASGTTYIAE